MMSRAKTHGRTASLENNLSSRNSEIKRQIQILEDWNIGSGIGREKDSWDERMIFLIFCLFVSKCWLYILLRKWVRWNCLACVLLLWWLFAIMFIQWRFTWILIKLRASMSLKTWVTTTYVWTVHPLPKSYNSETQNQNRCHRSQHNSTNSNSHL